MQITTIPSQATAVAALASRVTALTNDVLAQADSVAQLQAVAGPGAIYRPGADPGLNVFDTLDGAISALNVFGGGRCVIDDGGDPNAATTAGLTYDIDGIEFVGPGYATPTLNVTEGTSFSSPIYNQLSISNVSFSWSGTAPPLLVTSGSLGVSLDRFANITATADATGPLFGVDTGGNLYADVGYFCSVATNIGGHAAIDLGTSGSCELQVGVDATISADTVTGGGDMALLVTNLTAGLTPGGGAASISHTQTGTTNPVFAP